MAGEVFKHNMSHFTEQRTSDCSTAICFTVVRFLVMLHKLYRTQYNIAYSVNGKRTYKPKFNPTFTFGCRYVSLF